MYDIFRQSTGQTLFTTRFECVARIVTHFCRSLDYVVTGEGWHFSVDSDERFVYSRGEVCEIDHDSIQWDR